MPATVPSQDSPKAHAKSSILAFLLVCFAMACGFSCLSGAMYSDLGGDPDEAAHAVTALMVRDYLAEGFGQHPMKFARTYYDHFPRVALGHYPPFYYLVATVLLLPFPSPQALYILQAFLIAALGTVSFHLGRRLLPSWQAALAAVLGCALPLSLKLVQHIMSDILLAILCLWAVVVWADYLRAASLKKALLWGCIAAAAILTKGSGMLLCLLPPVATVLAGKWRLMRSLSWWCAALPVALLAGPWMLYSAGISKEGMTQLTAGQYFIEAVPYYMRSMPDVFGWGISMLAILGAVFELRKAWQSRAMSAEAAALTGLLIGTLAVLVLVPVGLSTRYMLTLVPVVMIAATAGIACVTRFLPMRFGIHADSFILLVAFISVSKAPMKEVHGFAEAVKFARADSSSESQENWLISSDPRGEGAVIAAATFQIDSRVKSSLRIYRGGKELASSDWMGRGYKQAVSTPESLLKLLDERQISWVLVDLSIPENQRREHDRLLEETFRVVPQSWALAKEQLLIRRVGQIGRLLIYQRVRKV